MRSTRYKGGGGVGGEANVLWTPGGAQGLTQREQAELKDLALSAGLTEQQALALANLDFRLPITERQAIALNALAMAGAAQEIQDITRLEIATSTILASKDSWVDALAVCTGSDNNHNATDLQIDGTTTAKEALAGWNLAQFPSNATVVAATVTFNVKTPHVTPVAADVFLIPAASENWTEAAVRCSNRPSPDGASLGTYPIGATGERSLDLPAAGRTRIAARMGTGTFSVLTRPLGGTLGIATLESKDEGTNDAAGPRLAITFTVPT